jgi:hypothetical protein
MTSVRNYRIMKIAAEEAVMAYFMATPQRD